MCMVEHALISLLPRLCQRCGDLQFERDSLLRVESERSGPVLVRRFNPDAWVKLI